MSEACGAVLRDGSCVADPRLDRIGKKDPRSASYTVAQLYDTALREPRSYSWAPPSPLNQGREGACVSFGFTHELGARPQVVTGLTEGFARELYWDIQGHDEYPGGEYPGASPRYAGTTVTAGAARLTARGFYSSYWWAESALEVASVISWQGPVVFGFPWYEGMSRPDRNGFVSLTGRLLGGHAFLGYGYSRKMRAVKCLNSWGPGWGESGSFFLPLDVVDELLVSQGGEACLPMRAKPAR